MTKRSHLDVFELGRQPSSAAHDPEFARRPDRRDALLWCGLLGVLNFTNLGHEVHAVAVLPTIEKAANLHGRMTRDSEVG